MSNPAQAPEIQPPSEAPIPERLYHQLQQWGVPLQGSTTAVLGSRNGRVCAALMRIGAKVVSVMETPGTSVVTSREGLLLVQGPQDEPPLRHLAFDVLLACNQAPKIEASRAVLPGGWMVMAGFQWLPGAPGPGRIAEGCLAKFGLVPASDEVSGVHPSWLRFLQGAGMEGIVSSSVDLDVPFDGATWRTAVFTEARRRGDLSASDWERFGSELDRALADSFPADLTGIPHRLFVTAGRKPQDQA